MVSGDVEIFDSSKEVINLNESDRKDQKHKKEREKNKLADQGTGLTAGSITSGKCCYFITDFACWMCLVVISNIVSTLIILLFRMIILMPCALLCIV